ncbi:MAG: biopolymer transporter ExbD [Wolinella succinogenes]|uniref:ExbD/TolR family protein n=1 Tax=Wolinella succinogenes TaxID=844 RepID=UPI0016AE4FD0|nr:biopolymer transporter ExbD [Wolinella succinogenes]NLU35226.1 biopolymer transporter ExbD [Wolinella succinogenes]
MTLKKIDGINIVPFIDIMLVLLVIVLTTATFVAQGQIPVTLPKAQSGSKPSQLKEREFTITEKGDYFLGKEPVSLEQLPKLITTLPKDSPIVIRGDAKSQFERFVVLVGALQDAGLNNLSIITKSSK